MRYLCIVLLLLLMPSVACGMSGYAHSEDMISLFDEVHHPQGKLLTLELSRVIDNFDAMPNVPKGLHRVYGHWGYSSAIPFEHGRLKEYLDTFPAGLEREAEMARIRDLWKNDVRRMNELVELWTGLPKGKVQRLTAIFYDMHVLGDWSTRETSSLQPVLEVGEDLLKNITKINRKVAAVLEPQLRAARGLHGHDSKALAAAYRGVFAGSPELKGSLDLALPKTFNRPLMIRSVVSRMKWRYNQLPLGSQKLLNQGGAAVLAAGLHGGYRYFAEGDSAEEAFAVFGRDAALGVVSTIVADAIITWIDDKIVLQAALNSGKGLANAFGASVNAGVMSFVFDAGQSLWNYASGDIEERALFQQVGHSALRSTGAGAASYCAVAIGFSATGPVVMVIGTGGYVLTSLLINEYEAQQALRYVALDELPGYLPLAVRHMASAPIAGHYPVGMFPQNIVPGHMPAQPASPGYMPAGHLPGMGEAPVPGHAPGGLPSGDIPGHMPQQVW